MSEAESVLAPSIGSRAQLLRADVCRMLLETQHGFAPDEFTREAVQSSRHGMH